MKKCEVREIRVSIALIYKTQSNETQATSLPIGVEKLNRRRT